MGIDASGWTTIIGAVLTLVVLEGLLSADNALVLAVMVRHLPKAQQKRALRYGIIGAFLFRLIAVIFASLLLGFWWLKVLGGIYLLYLAIRHFLARGEEDPEALAKAGTGFWATVVNVEIADIAFSIDSILAAVAMSERLPAKIADLVLVRLPIIGNVDMQLVIVYVGGILGIITMRMVAGVFLVLLDRFKGLAAGAYGLVAWIGVHLVGSGLREWNHKLPLDMPSWLFWGGMGAIILFSMLLGPKKTAPPTGATPEES
jgi:YkoY family integral membrane protein